MPIERGATFYVSDDTIAGARLDPRIALMQSAIESATQTLPDGTPYELLADHQTMRAPVENDAGEVTGYINRGWQIAWYHHSDMDLHAPLFCERDPQQWTYDRPRGCFVIGVLVTGEVIHDPS